MSNDTNAALAHLRERALQRLRTAGCEFDAGLDARLRQLAVASDFAIDTLCRQPQLLATLLADAASPLPAPALTAENRGEWQALLRRYRHAESTRLVWRDVLEGAPVPVPLPAAGGVFAAVLGLLGLWRRRPGRAASGA